MRILDRYIVREFLYSLLFILVTFIVIVFLVDVIERLDRFVDNAVPLWVIVQFYLLYIPEKVRLILPAAMMIASLYVMHKFRRSGELTAIRSNGVSMRRTFFPLLVTALLICGINLLSNEWWPMPQTSRARRDLARTHINRQPSGNLSHLRNITLQDSHNRVLNLASYDAAAQMGQQVDIQSTVDNRIVERINGPTLQWQATGWVLPEGVRRRFTDGHETVETLTNYTLDLNIRPEDLDRLGRNLQPEEMTYTELLAYIARLQSLGLDPRKWLVEVQNKLAYPLTGFIIVMFGLSFAAQPPFGKTSAGFGLVLLVSFLFIGVNVKAGPELGMKGVLEPVIAVWLGNVCFGLLGFLTLFRVRN